MLEVSAQERSCANVVLLAITVFLALTIGIAKLAWADGPTINTFTCSTPSLTITCTYNVTHNPVTGMGRVTVTGSDGTVYLDSSPGFSGTDKAAGGRCDPALYGSETCQDTFTVTVTCGTASLEVVVYHATAASAPASVSLNISPATTSAVLSPSSPNGNNGWYVSDVTVNLSLVAEQCPGSIIKYRVDAGAEQLGVSTTVSTDSAAHAVEYWAFWTNGTANYEETHNTTSFKMDKTPPTIAFTTRTPSSNTNGWNNTNVTVGGTCTDALSGPLSPTFSYNFTTEGANQSVASICQDLAGNSASSTQAGINIDKTPPVITYVSRTAANLNGWNNTNVTVNWNCTDSLSGPISASVNQTLTNEGANQSTTATCQDLADNTASNTQTNIDIDKTPPTVTFTGRTPSPNSYGWNNTNVTIIGTCTDALSGAVASSVSQTLTTEGANQSATANCQDLADNMASNTLAGIDIDKTPPAVSVQLAPTSPDGNNGWHRQNVGVTYICSDGLAGLDPATSCPTGTTLNTDGIFNLVSGSVQDKAGNTNSASATVKLDKTAPTITGSRSPAANFFGWNNSDITVSFSCSDATSGVQSCGASPQIVSSEGASQSRTGTAQDQAGNTATATVSNINIDNTSPLISGSRTPAANAFGWNNSNVSASFTCSDALSGVATTPTSPQVVTAEGANQSRSTSCTDKADNTAGATVSDINIDKTAPTVSLGLTPASPDGNNGWFRQNVGVTYNCSDGLSGLDPGTPCPANTTLTIDGLFNLSTGTIQDKAGNAESAAASLEIDKTPPSIMGVRNPAPNSFGWNNTNVTASFSCSDVLSGVDTFTAPITISSEGTSQSASGTCMDKAGNNVGTTVGGINIDKTRPTISTSRTPSPNANGWNNTNVTVNFTCSDGLSGVDTVTGSTTLSSEGSGQSVLGACDDKADNSTSTTVSNINIDKTSPAISGSRTPLANANGWNNVDVNVVFSCADGLSGVASVAGAKTISTEGIAQLATGTCTDLAGNTANSTVGNINIDRTPPSVSSSQDPAPNAAGWNNTSPVVVSWSGSDPLSGGVASGLASCSASSTISGETNGTAATGNCKDNADNLGTTTLTVKIDTIAPQVIASLSPNPNEQGWNNTNVSVTWSGTDGGSGIADCSLDNQVLSHETAGTAVQGRCVDAAGNVGTGSVTVKIDKTPPTVAITGGFKEGDTFIVGCPPSIDFSAQDTLSGLASSTSFLATGAPSGVGLSFQNVIAIDNAGNVMIKRSATFRFVYRFRGFMLPIDQEPGFNPPKSVFALGSIVPVRFQLADCKGNLVVNAIAQINVKKLNGVVASAELRKGTNEPADLGKLFQFREVILLATARAMAYEFRLDTSALAEGIWEIQVTLDDGTTRTVSIGLRKN